MLHSGQKFSKRTEGEEGGPMWGLIWALGHSRSGVSLPLSGAMTNKGEGV